MKNGYTTAFNIRDSSLMARSQRGHNCTELTDYCATLIQKFPPVADEYNAFNRVSEEIQN